MELTTKQDSRKLDIKFKEALKDTDFRRIIREQFSTMKQVSAPKNKTKSVELKHVQFHVDDVNRQSVNELIERYLKPLFNGVKEHLDETGFNACFELNKNFLSRTDYKISIEDYERYKINDFIFFVSMNQCRNESYSYEFEDADLSRDISPEEIEKVKRDAKFTSELINIYEVSIIFPVKKNAIKPRNKLR